MIDLMLVSILIRVLSALFPVAVALVMVLNFGIDLRVTVDRNFFIAVLIASVFVGALFYAFGCLLEAVFHSIRLSNRRTNAEEEAVRVQKWAAQNKPSATALQKMRKTP